VRSSNPAAADATYEFGVFQLDASRRELKRSGRAVAIEPKVYDVLAYLARHSNRVVSKRELFEALWPGETLSEGVLTRSVWAARKAVGDDGRQQQVIRTVQRHGYRFVAPLLAVAASSHPASEPTPKAGAASAQSGLLHPFVGRLSELSKLDRLFEAATHDVPQLAWVCGAAGIGKSRLIEEFARLARRRGARVLVGRVPHRGGVPPYWMWRELLRPIFLEHPRAALDRDLGSSVGLLSEVFPELAARYPERPPGRRLDGAEDRFLFFSALRDFVRRLSEREPLILVLEDVQWADPSSLMLLQSFVERGSSGRWLIVAAFRRFELRDDEPAKALCDEIVGRAEVKVLELEPLEPLDVGRLVEAVVGRKVQAAWVSQLAQRSEGVPLAAIELIRFLDEAGELDRPPVRGQRLPTGIAATLERRMDRLSMQCAQLLGRASVLGREFRVDQLAQLCDGSDEKLLQLLDEAHSAHILTESRAAVGQYQFRHALLRDAAYDRVSTPDRVSLHRRAGALLEASYGTSSEAPFAALAYHFSQSPFFEDQKRAAGYAQQAAELSLRILAYPEAAEHYSTAIKITEQLTPGEEVRIVRLLHGLGLAERGAGQHKDAEETFRQVVQRARRLVDRELFAEGAVQLEEARYTARTSPESSIPLLEEALEGLPKGPSLLRVQLLDRLAAAFNVQNDPRRLERSLEAVELARRLGDPVAMVQPLINRHVAIWGPDSLEERLSIDRELLELAGKVRQAQDSFGVGAEIWSSERSLSDLLEIGDLDGLQRAMQGARVNLEQALPDAAAPEAARRITADTRVLVHAQHLRLFENTVRLMQGDFANVEACALEVAAECQKLQAGNVLAGVQIQLFGLRYLQGRVEEVVPVIQLLLSQNPNFSHASRAGLAMALADLGRVDEALEEVTRVAPDGFAALPRDAFWAATLTSSSEALFLAGESRFADEIYGLLKPFAERTAMSAASYCAGSLARPLAMLSVLRGDREAAWVEFEQALQANRSLRARPFVASAEYAYAWALYHRAETKSLDTVIELLGQALATAREIGMRRLEQRILALQATVESAHSV